MQVLIRQTRQKGDQKIQLISSVLNVLLTFFLMAFLFQIIFATFFFNWFIEGAELLILLNLAIIALTLLSLYYLRRIYFKMIFNDYSLTLCSRFKLLNRKIRYGDILNILIDEKSNKRRIETKNEYFEIDDADVSMLIIKAHEKQIKIKKINVA